MNYGKYMEKYGTMEYFFPWKNMELWNIFFLGQIHLFPEIGKVQCIRVTVKCSLSHQNKSPCFQDNNSTLVSSASVY